MMTPQLQHPPVYLTAAFYLFVDLPNYVERRAALLAFCEAHNVKGSILLASEGINGTIAGAAPDVHAVLGYLRQDSKFSSLEHKESFANTPPSCRTSQQTCRTSSVGLARTCPMIRAAPLVGHS